MTPIGKGRESPVGKVSRQHMAGSREGGVSPFRETPPTFPTAACEISGGSWGGKVSRLVKEEVEA